MLGLKSIHISKSGPRGTPLALGQAYALQWRHNERDGVPNHQPHDCLLNRLFRRKSKKTSKLRVTGLCAGNSPLTGEFPAQMASNGENVSIWWRHHTIAPVPMRQHWRSLKHPNQLKMYCDYNNIQHMKTVCIFYGMYCTSRDLFALLLTQIRWWHGWLITSAQNCSV